MDRINYARGKKSVELGSFIDVPRWMAEIAKQGMTEADANKKYGTLFGVGFAIEDNGDDPFNDEWITRVKSQAIVYMAKHGKILSPPAKAMLEKLTML